MDFSPVASSRAASPSKKTVTRGENMEDYDILYELDDSVCSSFSDVEYGSSNGAMKSVGGNVTSRKSPVEVSLVVWWVCRCVC